VRSPVVLRDQRSAVRALHVSPDGQWLTTGSEGGFLSLTPLRVDDLLDAARRAAGRNLTRAEWQELFPDQPYRETFEGLSAPTPSGVESKPAPRGAATRGVDLRRVRTCVGMLSMRME
jgi:hypothetical protein